MNKTLISALIISTSVYAASAQATDVERTGFFVGSQVGELHTKVVDTHLDTTLAKKKTGDMGIYGGYNFSSWFGIEANLYGAKDVDYAGIKGDTYVAAISPKFTLWLNDRLAVFAKVGVAAISINAADSQETIGDAQYDPAQNWTSNNFNGVGLAAGAGVNFAVTRNINLRLSYDYARGTIENDNFGKANDKFQTTLSQTSLGVNYQF